MDKNDIMCYRGEGGELLMNFISIGAVKACPEIAPHTHDAWEMVYYTQGKVVLDIDGTEHKLGAGNFVLQPKGVTHSEQGQPTFDNFYFSIKENRLLPKRTVIVEDTPDKTILRLLRLLNYHYHAKRRNYQNICEALVQSVLHYVSGLEQTSGTDEYVLHFVQILIDAIPDCHFKIAEAMAQMPYTPDYFRKIFIAGMHCTPIEYLNELRINKAKDLMETSPSAHRIPLKNIAHMCGFSDPFYFSRAFKKHTGVAPSRWRGGE